MARLRRRERHAAAQSNLKSGHLWLLLFGFSHGEEDFASAEEYQAAWWQHREELVFSLAPFTRPCAFWWVELRMAPPDSAAGGWESQRSALLRLGLQLSDLEKRLLLASEKDKLSA